MSCTIMQSDIYNIYGVWVNPKVKVFNEPRHLPDWRHVTLHSCHITLSRSHSTTATNITVFISICNTDFHWESLERKILFDPQLCKCATIMSSNYCNWVTSMKMKISMTNVHQSNQTGLGNTNGWQVSMKKVVKKNENRSTLFGWTKINETEIHGTDVPPQSFCCLSIMQPTNMYTKQFVELAPP